MISYWVPARRYVEPRRSTSRIIPNEDIRQTRETRRVQERVQEPKWAQTCIDPRAIQQRNDTRKGRRTGGGSTDEGGRAGDEDAEEVALGRDVGVGATGGVEEAGVGAFGKGGEVRRDDGVLVGRTGEVVGEATAGEEARDSGLGNVVGGTDGGHAGLRHFVIRRKDIKKEGDECSQWTASGESGDEDGGVCAVVGEALLSGGIRVACRTIRLD